MAIFLSRGVEPLGKKSAWNNEKNSYKATEKGIFIRMSDPGNFSSKTLNVVFLLCQHILGNE